VAGLVKLFKHYIPKEAGKEISKLLQGDFIGQGKVVDEFEDEFCRVFKQAFAISVNSGTAALETAYDLIGLKEGDEVISTPLTCSATNIPLLRKGVNIVWADVLEDTLTIDPWDVRSKITEKTKAIVQVHLGGIKADVGEVQIPVVSDACQALGVFNGTYTCCSFQAIKHITTGDGGMITMRSKEDYHKAKLLRWFGIDREKKIACGWQAYKEREMTFDIEVLGYKRHMNDICATLGLIGLKHYQTILNYRKKLFDIYKNELYGVDGIKLIDGKVNTYWLCTVLVNRRDDFAKMLKENGVETNMVQIRNDLYKIFGGKRAELPVLDRIENQYLSLPIGQHVTENQVKRTCSLIKKGW
jgi:dTDP-4-amino-4,6-dideoxygalactose transaminase